MEDLGQPRENLALISTQWAFINDPMKFVMRYAAAVRGYLRILLPTPADSDEVLQEFLLSVLERGFSPDRVRRGRFRDYLIATIRYRAWRYLRRKSPRPLSVEQAEELPAPVQFVQEEQEWLAGWRRCLLERAWDALECRQRQLPGNRYYTVLKLTIDHPGVDSKTLAAQVAADPPMTPAAFRKQVSRARAAFARALVDEVERTLQNPTTDAVMEELADVGVLGYVRPYLKGQHSHRLDR